MHGTRLLLSTILFFAAAVPETRARSAEKIMICHIDEQTETGLLGSVILIAAAAWPAHEKHADYMVQGLTVGDLCGIIE